MPAPKRSATKPSPAARPVIRPAAGSATPRVDPQLELFGRAVAATQQKHWKQAAGLLRRLLADTDDDPSLGEAVEHLTVQKFVAKLGVEALAVAVFPWRAWLDEGRFCADRCDPIPHCLGDELGTVAHWEDARPLADLARSLA